MQKVAIIAHSSQKEEILNYLHEAGVAEIRDAKDPVAVDHTAVNFRTADLHFAISTLQEAASKEAIAASQKKVDVETIMKAANHTDVLAVVEELRTLEAQDTDAEREIQEARNIQSALGPWMKLPYELSTDNESQTAVRILGTVPKAAWETFESDVHKAITKSTLEQISVQDDVYCCANVWKEDASTFEKIATNHGWSNVELPKLEGSAATEHEKAVLQEKSAQQVRQKNNDRRTQLATELANLVRVATFVSWLDQKQTVREAMNETDSTFTLLAWVPKSDVASLESKLQKISKAVAVLKVKPDEGEEPPVYLKNPKFITPFESVTTLYGLPLSSENDPTFSLAPFFILYFSLCLTDAGYGAVLAIIFGIVLWKTKLQPKDNPLLWCLFMSGVMAFIVGIFFGGYFGLAPEQMPDALSFLTKENGTLFRGQVWNLSTQTGVEFLQNLALVLGITHLSFGMFLAGLHKWVHGQKMRAFWEDFTSHLLIGGGIFLAVAPEAMKETATMVMYAIVAIAIWGKGYGAAWYLRPLMGLLGLVNFGIGMLSNSLSYLRILALGLVTGALAMAVNQVAVELGKLFPIWLAIPIIIVVFVVGHLVSIALNTLGSFIHAARLQFIEFFSQFFEGGGKGFSPFRRTLS